MLFIVFSASSRLHPLAVGTRPPGGGYASRRDVIQPPQDRVSPANRLEVSPHRLDELSHSGSTGKTRVRPIDPAGKIRRPPIRRERINAVQDDRWRARERNLGSIGAGRQETIRDLVVTTTKLNQGRLDSRPCLDPVRALIDMKDLHAHTQVSHRARLPPGCCLDCPAWSEFDWQRHATLKFGCQDFATPAAWSGTDVNFSRGGRLYSLAFGRSGMVTDFGARCS